MATNQRVGPSKPWEPGKGQGGEASEFENEPEGEIDRGHHGCSLVLGYDN